MIQYMIKIYDTKIENICLMYWIGVFYCLYYGNNCNVVSVVYLAYEDVVLGHG